MRDAKLILPIMLTLFISIFPTGCNKNGQKMPEISNDTKAVMEKPRYGEKDVMGRADNAFTPVVISVLATPVPFKRV